MTMAKPDGGERPLATNRKAFFQYHVLERAEAGIARLRPILMTSLTTALGLLPMALGFGEGSEVRTPMAITVIGGLLVSTLLTLVVIPVVYSLLDRKRWPVAAPLTAAQGQP